MRVEDCIFTVERRSLGGCVDVAFVFTRHFALPILRLWALFAIPSCICVWMLTSRNTDMFFTSLVIFSGFAALFSGALVAGMGPQVFGVPISTRRALADLYRQIVSYGFLTAAARSIQFVGTFCLFIPTVLVTAFFGHLAEVVLLEQTRFSQVVQRMGALCQGGGYYRNLGRLLLLLCLWVVCSLGLFLIIDFLAAALFNEPIFSSRLPMGPDLFQAFVGLLNEDPLVLTTLQLSLWLPFPIIRLAWFFCYLDQRIRNECWDLELQFRVEAVRLGEVG